MSRLHEGLHESLTPEILSALFNKSIFTCLAFVRTTPDVLIRITDLHYSQILEIKDAILTRFSSRLRGGHKYYQDILNHCAILPTGIENLDKLLNFGLVTGNIYELCGFSGSGKTQICMTIAVNICISTKGQQVLYLDTKNDSFSRRLWDITSSRKVPSVAKVVERIWFCHIRTAHDLLKELHQFKHCLERSKNKYLGFKVIIIDSLSALFQQLQDHDESQSLLNNTANILRYISSEYHLIVLLTNLARSWTSAEIEAEDVEGLQQQQLEQPGLGKYWAHVPDVRMMVKKPEGNECFVIILKSPDQPVGKSVKVVIGDGGVT